MSFQQKERRHNESSDGRVGRMGQQSFNAQTRSPSALSRRSVSTMSILHTTGAELQLPELDSSSATSKVVKGTLPQETRNNHSFNLNSTRERYVSTIPSRNISVTSRSRSPFHSSSNTSISSSSNGVSIRRHVNVDDGDLQYQHHYTPNRHTEHVQDSSWTKGMRQRQPSQFSHNSCSLLSPQLTPRRTRDPNVLHYPEKVVIVSEPLFRPTYSAKQQVSASLMPKIGQVQHGSRGFEGENANNMLRTSESSSKLHSNANPPGPSELTRVVMESSLLQRPQASVRPEISFLQSLLQDNDSTSTLPEQKALMGRENETLTSDSFQSTLPLQSLHQKTPALQPQSVSEVKPFVRHDISTSPSPLEQKFTSEVVFDSTLELSQHTPQTEPQRTLHTRSPSLLRSSENENSTNVTNPTTQSKNESQNVPADSSLSNIRFFFEKLRDISSTTRSVGTPMSATEQHQWDALSTRLARPSGLSIPERALITRFSILFQDQETRFREEVARVNGLLIETKSRESYAVESVRALEDQNALLWARYASMAGENGLLKDEVGRLSAEREALETTSTQREQRSDAHSKEREELVRQYARLAHESSERLATLADSKKELYSQISFYKMALASAGVEGNSGIPSSKLDWATQGQKERKTHKDVAFSSLEIKDQSPQNQNITSVEHVWKLELDLETALLRNKELSTRVRELEMKSTSHGEKKLEIKGTSTFESLESLHAKVESYKAKLHRRNDEVKASSFRIELLEKSLRNSTTQIEKAENEIRRLRKIVEKEQKEFSDSKKRFTKEQERHQAQTSMFVEQICDLQEKLAHGRN